MSSSSSSEGGTLGSLVLGKLLSSGEPNEGGTWEEEEKDIGTGTKKEKDVVGVRRGCCSAASRTAAELVVRKRANARVAGSMIGGGADLVLVIDEDIYEDQDARGTRFLGQQGYLLINKPLKRPFNIARLEGG